MKQNYVTHSPSETIELGKQLAKELAPGCVVILSGDLGSGKTCLLKGVAETLGVNPKDVASPTFTLVNEYVAPGGFRMLHADAYRIEHDVDWDRLALIEELDADAMIFIEWGEKFRHLIPEAAVHIHFQMTEGSTRKIEVAKYE